MTFPDVDTIDSYGGALDNAAAVIDSTTDRDAGAMNQALESVAEMTHTAARAWARVVLGTTGGNPQLAAANGGDAGWGNSSPPVPSHSTTGVYTLTWPATVVDGLDVTHNLNFRWATAKVEGATFGFAQASVSAANVVTLNTGNAAGSANDLSGVTVYVEVG